MIPNAHRICIFFQPVKSFLSISEAAQKALERLKINNLRDLVFYKPTTYNIIKIDPDLATLRSGDLIQAEVIIEDVLRAASRASPLKIKVSNATGSIILVFFNKIHPFIFGKLRVGQKYIITGRVEIFDHSLQISHPEFIFKQNLITSVMPVYPLTYGIVNKQLYGYIREAITILENAINSNGTFSTQNLEEKKYIDELLNEIKNLHLIPFTILNQTNEFQGEVAQLSDLGEHSRDLQNSFVSFKMVNGIISQHGADYDIKKNIELNMKKLAAKELLANQVSLLKIKTQEHQNGGRSFAPNYGIREVILSKLGFELTNAQLEAITEIEHDQLSDVQMMRMLQGDVGSGKTLVALITILNVVTSGVQAALMAPTDLLTIQHYQFFCHALENTEIKVELLTGKTSAKQQKRIKQDLLNGKIDILIGTHALFQKGVEFKDLGYIIIDEQHRFGVEQRLELIKKASHPDVLVMTATPIPRSLTLTMFGDMSVSQLKTKPSNRLPIITSVLSNKKRSEVVNSLARKLAMGEKIYWVCPLIDQSDETLKTIVTNENNAGSVIFADVTARFAELNNIYPGQVSMLHGKMKGPMKDQIMQEFKEGNARILVATTVIEVGIDVPDSNLIIIENAEKFGLAQLHQLRGRVGRGSKQSHCLLMYESERLSAMAKERLKIMHNSSDGFYIAEQDLILRGGGEILGTKQSGEPIFFFADLARDLKILLQANNIAKSLTINEFIDFQIDLFARNKRNLIKSG